MVDGGGAEDDRLPLVGAEAEVEVDLKASHDESHVARTGTVWSATAHIITAVIGSGVLSLAWSVAQLGWIAGPLSIVGFAAITMIQSHLLSDCYRSPDPVNGHIRNRTYMDAVKFNLGKMDVWICGLIQQLNLYGLGIAYTITSANSMRAVQKSNCYHREGHNAGCSYSKVIYMLMFGAIQIVLSFIPDFHNMAWLSVVAAIMSFSYSTIGFALGLAKTIGDGKIKGSIEGVTSALSSQKFWRVSQAIGDVAFAYPFAIILLEIQDTLKSPPPENQTMKKASTTSILITTIFYLLCSCFGYAAFGDDTAGDLLTGFGFYEPYWLVDFANVCVVIHLVGAYQLFSQPVFGVIERWFVNKFPDNGFVNNSYVIDIPIIKSFKMNLLKLCFRTAYALSTTGLAILFPYFNDVLGLLGAFNFWPMVVYFPVKMYFVSNKIATWSRIWIFFQMLNLFCFLVSIFAMVGSFEGLISTTLS